MPCNLYGQRISHLIHSLFNNVCRSNYIWYSKQYSYQRHAPTIVTHMITSLVVHWHVSENPKLQRNTSTEQNVLGSRMPNNEANTSLVCYQVSNWFFEICRQSTVGDLPDFDRAVFRSACNQIVIVRTPLDVQHCSFVSDNEWCFAVNSSDLTTDTDETNILQTAAVTAVT